MNLVKFVGQVVTRGCKPRNYYLAAAGEDDNSAHRFPPTLPPERHANTMDVARCCRAGARSMELFTQLVADYRLDEETPIVARLVDFSASTKGQVGEALAPALEVSRQALLTKGADGYIWDLGFNAEVFALDAANPLRTIATARVITRSDFTPKGFVESGTNLSKGLATAIAVLTAHHLRGHKGDLLVSAWTDGWDTSDQSDRVLCRDALQLARQQGIKVEVYGFCPTAKYQRYQEWRRRVGLRTSEDNVKILGEDDSVSDAVFESVTGFGESISETMLGRRAKKDPKDSQE